MKTRAAKLLEKPALPLTIGSALEAIRQERNVSLTEFAQILGISSSHLCNIEKGRKGVSPTRAEDFAEALGYPGTQFSKLLRKLK